MIARYHQPFHINGLIRKSAERELHCARAPQSAGRRYLTGSVVIVTVLLFFFGKVTDDVAQVIDGFGITVVHWLINTDVISGLVFAAVVIPFSLRYFPPYCSDSLSYWVGSLIKVPVEIEHDMGMASVVYRVLEYPEIPCQICVLQSAFNQHAYFSLSFVRE